MEAAVGPGEGKDKDKGKGKGKSVQEVRVFLGIITTKPEAQNPPLTSVSRRSIGYDKIVVPFSGSLLFLFVLFFFTNHACMHRAQFE